MTASNVVQGDEDPSTGNAPLVTARTEDEEGRITHISGVSPVGILQAYCAGSQSGSPCKPLRVEPTRPHRAGIKLGVLETIQDPGVEYAIWIRKNQDRPGWFAGNGLKPLRAEPLEP